MKHHIVSFTNTALTVLTILGSVYFGHHLTVTAQHLACPNPITILENR
jgi:hypothetical protein